MSSKSGTSTSELDKFKEKYPDATEDDFKKYKLEKQKWFKGTIVVCVIYGVFALVLLLLTIFFQPARDILADRLLTFVATLVGGMIFIIILLIVQIVTFQPKVFSKLKYDPDMCPDYWKLEKVPESELDGMTMATAEEKMLMSYRCVPDSNVYNVGAKPFGVSAAINIYGQTISGSDQYVDVASIADTNVATAKFKNSSKALAKKMSNDSVSANANRLHCNKVYPNLLASVEANDTDLKKKPNQLRCAYAQQCGIPWTSVCPNKEDISSSTLY